MIETKLARLNADSPDEAPIMEAAAILRKGGLVAFPTETVYGLGADALNAEAVEHVFQAKGRPMDNPLIVHIADRDQLFELADEIPEKGLRLAKEFWPGPLTLVVNKTFLVPDVVTAGQKTVAVRVPDHPVALALIAAVGSGIVGPSANISGRPSPTTGEHVFADLKGRIDMVLDTGPTEIGIESTVVDVTIDPPAILRSGGLYKESLEDIVGPVRYASEGELLRRSPGTRHRHYAPKAEVVLVKEGDMKGLTDNLQKFRQKGKTVGCIVHSHALAKVESGDYFRILPTPIEFFARYLFRTFREFDEGGIQVILVETVAEKGLGAAVMDRLRRAAASR